MKPVSAIVCYNPYGMGQRISRRVTTRVFSRRPRFPSRDHYMRAALVDTYYETLDYCFDMVLGDMLGSTVRESVYNLLERNGIQRREFGTRFDNVVEILTRSLGSCCRVVVHRTVTEMYKQYSQRLDFNYDDSLREKLNLLKESTIANHLVPRRHYETSAFDSLYQQVRGNGDSPQSGASQSSFYPLKKGVKT